MKKLKHADIFCGIGGFSEALRGMAKPVVACDIDPKARMVYEANYKPERMYADLSDLIASGDLHSMGIDILTAGIPCQPYSRIGKKKGLQDKRANVIPLLIEAIKQAQPQHLILECVPEFRNKIYEQELSPALKDLGYNFEFEGIFSGYEFNNPTLRKRWFSYVGKRPVGKYKNFLEVSNPKPLTLKNLLKKNFEKDYAYTFRKGGQGSGITSRHNWDTYMVDGQPYTLTARDCLDVMGFRRNFIIPVYISERQMKSLIGNSICVNIPKWIVQNELD